MKRNLILVLSALLLIPILISGCFSGIPSDITDVIPDTGGSNQPPTAYIDLISPDEAAPGELISFTGHGTDTDGTIVAYRWRSNIDGQLSIAASFDTAELSEGDHIISFKVQDNNDAWSEEAAEIVTVVASEVEPEELAILYFEADPASIISGDSSTLSWATTGASEVSIDEGIGVVDTEGTYAVTLHGDQTVNYTLTASDGSDTVTATVNVQSHLIMVMPDAYELTLNALINESGYVRSNGQVTPKWIYAGDDNNDIPLQGFFSFNISGLPEDAMIDSVTFDLSDHDNFLGDPLDDLGCLRVFVDDYGTLDSSDYTPALFKMIGIATYCTVGEIVPEENEAVEDALQDRVGEPRLQFRLQFTTHSTDGHNDNDIARWNSTHLPQITIHYYSYVEPM
ncbi:hypothetical protein ACFLUH_00745 [Chloroflexota bacterium]